MFIAILELRHTIQEHSHLYLFSLFVALTWAIWVLKVVLSRATGRAPAPYDVTTIVVIPVVDEPLDLFRDVLAPHRRAATGRGHRRDQRPAQPATRGGLRGVRPAGAVAWTPIAGQAQRGPGRHRAGPAARSWSWSTRDTIWTDGTLPELVKPFADRASVASPRGSASSTPQLPVTRWADWLENTRALYSMPAQSVARPGRLPARAAPSRSAAHILRRGAWTSS